MIQNMREKHSKRSEYIAKMKETDRERDGDQKIGPAGEKQEK